jgi:Phosphotransferase enzyme family
VDTDNVARAVAAVTSVAADLDLPVQEVAVIQNSNKLALRLLPCDVVARVAPKGQEVAALEVELAEQLVAAEAPVAALEPSVEPCVYQRDGFAVTFWTYYDTRSSGQLSPAAYAHALERLHTGMRNIDVATPHVTDRIEAAERLVANRDRTPALDRAGRELLLNTLNSVRLYIERSGADEQLLHGEPHPGNALNTTDGPLFIDLETCCRGQVEFDVAHVPGDVTLATSSPTDSVTPEPSSPFSAAVHPGQHSLSSAARDHIDETGVIVQIDATRAHRVAKVDDADRRSREFIRRFLATLSEGISRRCDR